MRDSETSFRTPLGHWLRRALYVTLVASVGAGCGTPSEPATPSNGAKGTGRAPEVTPAYTEEELARLTLCPFVVVTVFVAGQNKANGVPLEALEQEIQEQPLADDIRKLSLLFTQQTYEDNYPDQVEYVRELSDTCIAEIGEIKGARASRAGFCLGRQLTALAGYRLHQEQTLEELSTRLKDVPGYSLEVLERGYQGNKPDFKESWTECVEG